MISNTPGPPPRVRQPVKCLLLSYAEMKLHVCSSVTICIVRSMQNTSTVSRSRHLSRLNHDILSKHILVNRLVFLIDLPNWAKTTCGSSRRSCTIASLLPTVALGGASFPS